MTILNNLYASLSSPNLLENVRTTENRIYEYEDILRKKGNTTNARVSDILARESDVIISNKITSKTEYNGFAVHLLSNCFLIIWLAWSLVPQSWFHKAGIYYYPDRWWQLAISSYILVAMGFIYVMLALYNIEVKAKPLDDICNITDEHAIITQEDECLWKSTSGVWDLPISKVSKILYSDYGDDHSQTNDNYNDYENEENDNDKL